MLPLKKFAMLPTNKISNEASRKTRTFKKMRGCIAKYIRRKHKENVEETFVRESMKRKH